MNTSSIDKRKDDNYMGYWDFERDSDKTCFDHLDKHVPQSIREEAKEELRYRGYSDNYIREKEYERSRSW